MNKNVVIITAIQTNHNPMRAEGYSYSIKSWKNWCDKHDVDLFVLDAPINDMKPNYQRYWCFDLLQGTDYDNICLVDADTIINPLTENFFNFHKNGTISVVCNDGDMDWVARSIEAYQIAFPELEKQVDIWKYFNSGFLVFDNRSNTLFKTFCEFVIANRKRLEEIEKAYGVGTDQPILNKFIVNSDVKVNFLPYRFNMQDMGRKNILHRFTDIVGIYHFNAIEGGPNKVNDLMKKCQL